MKPNILFLSLDDFRADMFYGVKKTSITPNIDSLIKKGTYCTQAISSSDSTAVSLGSIITSLYPYNAANRKGVRYYKLYSDVIHYPNILKEAGYHAYGLMHKSTLLSDILSDFENKDKTYPLTHRLYDGLGEELVEKFSQITEPWLFFLHILDLHKPMSLPKKFNVEKYGVTEYDRMVSAIDVWIGKILEQIDLNNTIVVITSDHGEYERSIQRDGKTISLEFIKQGKIALQISKFVPQSLNRYKRRIFLKLRVTMTNLQLAKTKDLELTPYEQRSLTKSRSDTDRYLYDDLFRVPILFSGYKFPKGKIITQQVGVIDIFPTIVDVIGLPHKNNDIDGISISPAFSDKNIERPIYMESGINTEKSSEGVVGVRTPNYKYFVNVGMSPKQVHLYNLQDDPLEEKNIALENPTTVKKMNNILKSLIENSQNKTQTQDMSDKEIQDIEKELKKLGYI